jgi:hypothetical protein
MRHAAVQDRAGEQEVELAQIIWLLARLGLVWDVRTRATKGT